MANERLPTTLQDGLAQLFEHVAFVLAAEVGEPNGGDLFDRDEIERRFGGEVADRASARLEILVSTNEQDRRGKLIHEAQQRRFSAQNVASILSGPIPFGPDNELLLKLLADPLSSPTRTIRRNLVVVSGASMLVSLSEKLPHELPALGMKLGGGGFVVLVSLLAVLVYEGYGWWRYQSADKAGYRLLQEKLQRLLESTQRALAPLRTISEVAERDTDLAEKLDAFVRKEGQPKSFVEVVSIDSKRLKAVEDQMKNAEGRFRFDHLVPLIAAGVGGLALVSRIACER